MTFAIADEEENSDLFREFGFDDSSEEINVGIIGPQERKYPMEPMEEFETDEILRFLRTFMKGSCLFIVFGQYTDFLFVSCMQNYRTRC